MNAYTLAKERYAALGVDTEAVLETLKNVTVSVHCWQGDDVVGFDAKEALSGGIQTTGNYPGKATTPEQLMADFDEVLRLTPGKKKLNLHASYAIFEAGEFADRDAIQPKHFSRWVAYAKERGLGIDFNPTFFSHSMVKDGLTLSSPDETVRHFWVEHGKRCMSIAEYFAEETGKPCVINFWIPDGYKDYPADRLSPRRRYAQSMDEILSVPYDKTKVFPCIESKVFGIGLEAYTVGSAEFCTNYVNTRRITPLMDNGHYHPTEVVSDKIPALLAFFPEIALHVTRPIRWDSDHVVLLDDETKEICKEIVRCGGLDGRVNIALDYFDASINRISAWTVGFRNVQKALLSALLTPNDALRALQDEQRFTELMVRQEALKTMPFGDVWDEYCRSCNVPVGTDWFETVQKYERDVLSKRV